MGVVLPIDHRRKALTDFIDDFSQRKTVITQQDWDNFADNLEKANFKSKAIAVRMAKTYGMTRPLHYSDIDKLPSHIRGYGIAGAMDSTKDYEYLDNLYMKGKIVFSDLVQAVEGWIIGDPNKLVVSYYKKKAYCPDKWAKELIETSLWGDSLRAAVALAAIEKRHLEWAIDLIRHRQVGDPSNAAVDLFEASMIPNLNYIQEILYHDRVGCPSSAARRLKEQKLISKHLFQCYVKGAKSGDPARAVQESELANDVDFAKMIAEQDMTPSAPRLAIWLVNNKNADPKWAYELLMKSKHAKNIDSLSREILLDRIHNPLMDDFRQSKRGRMAERDGY